ncbi:MAG: AAA family ATPase [Bacteroidetes bacterium]|nr:AAA family ATPase [Bacteroidota bacterium]
MAEIYFERSASTQLNHWREDPSTPGLILYGARQTGKTSLVDEFSRKFRQFIHLDLKDPGDLKIFRQSGSSEDFLNTIFLLKGKDTNPKKTLIFFDCTCRDPQVINLAEDIISRQPGVKVIISCAIQLPQIPRGFTSLYIRPLSFNEFLRANGNSEAIEAFSEVPFPVSGFHTLLGLFHQYSLIGGMPAVVKKFVLSRSMSSLKPVYEGILKEFYNDIESSSFRQNKKDLLTITLQNAFMYAGTRIKFNAFGNVPYGSREMSNTFRYLENSMLLSLNYPTVATIPPPEPDMNKFPRLQMLDTGLMTYFSGIQKQMILAMDLNALFEGQVLRHVVGQELLSGKTEGPSSLDYWVRSKAQSSAELDYVIPFENLLIPVVVKSGEPGRLRSLHQFIDEAPHSFAIRLHAGNVSIRKAETLKGKPYYLLSLPYFLAYRIPEHLKGFIRYVES